MKMKLTIIIFGILLLISSCKKETNYGYWIGIHNRTTKEIQVKVFPKSELIKGDQYNISSYNDFSDMVFTIAPNETENLYQSAKLDYEPELLLKEIFDSIAIEIKLDSTVVIKFRPESVENYSRNMYAKNSIWHFILKEGSERTSLSSIPFEIQDYQFEIKEEEIR